MPHCALFVVRDHGFVYTSQVQQRQHGVVSMGGQPMFLFTRALRFVHRRGRVQTGSVRDWPSGQVCMVRQQAMWLSGVRELQRFEWQPRRLSVGAVRVCHSRSQRAGELGTCPGAPSSGCKYGLSKCECRSCSDFSWNPGGCAFHSNGFVALTPVAPGATAKCADADLACSYSPVTRLCTCPERRKRAAMDGDGHCACAAPSAPSPAASSNDWLLPVVLGVSLFGLCCLALIAAAVVVRRRRAASTRELLDSYNTSSGTQSLNDPTEMVTTRHHEYGRISDIMTTAPMYDQAPPLE